MICPSQPPTDFGAAWRERVCVQSHGKFDRMVAKKRPDPHECIAIGAHGMHGAEEWSAFGCQRPGQTQNRRPMLRYCTCQRRVTVDV